MWLLAKLLRRIIHTGELILIDYDGREYRFGSPDPNREPVVIRLTAKQAATASAGNPRLGAGEGYMNGRLVMERGEIIDLVALIRYNTRWGRGGVKLHEGISLG